ncbi:hypothetical protein ACFQ3Z_04265 [Streptomyces nogalater]
MTSHSPTAPVRAWAAGRADRRPRRREHLGPAGRGTPLPGFVRSPSHPRPRRGAAVRRPAGQRGQPGRGRGARTAIVLGSMACDAVTADIAGEKVARGGVAEPVLFHQTVTTAVLGVIARDYRITGPVTCVSSMTDPGPRCSGRRSCCSPRRRRTRSWRSSSNSLPARARRPRSPRRPKNA